MDTTPNLALPYIMAAQAQKHVTHNEAIRALDAIVQIGVLDQDLAAPPASPTDGDRYIVATGATGDWTGKDDQLAAWQDNAWMFHVPVEGWLAWVADEDALLAWDGSAWIAVSSGGGGSVNPAPLVGVNTTAAAPNRLAVKSDAVLFSHDDVTPGTGDMRTVLNKAATGGTASFLFQTGFSGRAEIGTTGDDDFHFKVSADGTNFVDAMTINNAGKGLFGHTASVGTAGASLEPNVQIHGVGASGSFGCYRYTSVGGGGALFTMSASRGALGGHGALLNNDGVGTLGFYASDGATFVNNAAQLLVQIDGAVSAGVTPMKMILKTMNSSGTQVNALVANGSGVLTAGGNVEPNVDNTHDLGNASLRWDDIYATNATIQTSDKRNKKDIADLPYGLDLVRQLRPVEYRWKNKIAAEVTETVTRQRPVTQSVRRAREEIVEVDGKYVRKNIIETVEEPVYDMHPLFDEAGKPILDAAGEAILHRAPRIENFTETTVVSPAVNKTHKRKHFGLIAQDVEQLLNDNNIDTAGFSAFIYDKATDRYGLRYGELIPVLIKAVQDLVAKHDALKTRVGVLKNAGPVR